MKFRHGLPRLTRAPHPFFAAFYDGHSAMLMDGRVRSLRSSS